ncbi:MAG TPA: hypothetical protein VEB19_09925 [Gemmatimonadaceae bacterium]|nr:hypothetical protein [Gemmatimonadaceae bacterium]
MPDGQDRSRDKFRDNDDVREPLSPDDRSGTRPDTKSEARGDARETVGNNARGTDIEPKGPEFNDNQRRRQNGQPPSRD